MLKWDQHCQSLFAVMLKSTGNSGPACGVYTFILYYTMYTNLKHELLNQQSHNHPPRRRTCVGDMCVVTAYQNMEKDTPIFFRGQPLLVFPATLHPITAKWLTTAFRAAASRLGLEPLKHSLHSLKQSAASHAYGGQFHHLQGQRFGGWSSSAYHRYISTKGANEVTTSLVQNLHKD